MRKPLLPILILLLITALLPAAELESHAEVAGGFTLLHITSAEDELPLRSALSAEVRIAPILIGSESLKAGVYLNASFQTPTPVHNSIRFDGSIKGGGGLLLTYRFTPLLTGEASIGTSLGKYLMSTALIASLDAALALRITPTELIAIVPRLTLSAESERILLAFRIGTAVNIGWNR